jgi:nicotinamidase-related amidase
MKEAIFIVDMLNDFRDGALPNPRMELIIGNIIELIEEELQGPEKVDIFFLCDQHEPGDEEFKLFGPHCLPGTRGAEIIDELQRFVAADKSNIILKNKFSAFYGTRLDEILAEKKPDRVIAVGVLADICVLMNVVELRYRGYPTLVPRSCVETYDAPGHDAGEINRFAFGYMQGVLGAQVTERL